MDNLLLPKRIRRQVILVAFDELEIVGTGKDFEVALPDADGAVAVSDGRDLGRLELKDECTAVAVAPVVLERLLVVFHGGRV